MSYEKALIAAGAEIKEYIEFGSYQGTWMALLMDGRIVEGSYGSCSGCDAFEAEFGWNDRILEQHEDGKYYKYSYADPEDEITKEEAEKHNTAIHERLVSFGQSYLNDAQSLEMAISRYTEKCNQEYAWSDDKEILDWLKSIMKVSA